MDNDWLNLAVQAFHNNDLTRASELLWGYVNYYRDDARGWLWYSRVLSRREDKLACLQHALALSPHDPAILEEWKRVAGRAAMASKPSIRSVPPNVRTKPRAARPAFALSLQTIGFVFQACLLASAFILFLVALFSVLPMFFGNRTLVILSGSMEPTIPTGGIVLAQPVPARQLEIGDIIVYSPGAESQIPIVHRIVNISERRGTRYYTTRGDANPNVDHAEVALPPTAWRVTFSAPFVGYIITFASSPPGIFLLIVLPLMGLVALTVWDWLGRFRVPLGAPHRSPRPTR